jgi:hypothetical protein
VRSSDGANGTAGSGDGGGAEAKYRPIIQKRAKKMGVKKIKKRAEREAKKQKALERQEAKKRANTPVNKRAKLLVLASKFERKAERAAERAAGYRQQAESLAVEVTAQVRGIIGCLAVPGVALHSAGCC